MNADIHERVTNKLIADLEQSELTQLKPWSDPGAVSENRRMANASRLDKNSLGNHDQKF